MNWKLLRLTLTGLVLAAAVGCGGLNGSYNVSPASFILPGIGQHTPATTNSVVHTVAVVE